MLFHYKATYVDLLLKLSGQALIQHFDVAFSLNKTYYLLIVDPLLFLVDISSVSHEITVIEMSHLELIGHLCDMS